MPLSMNATPIIELGRYRHFKGGVYDVIGIAQDSDRTYAFS